MLGIGRCHQVQVECFASGAMPGHKKLHLRPYYTGYTFLFLFQLLYASGAIYIMESSLKFCSFLQLSSNEVTFRTDRLYVNKLNIILVQVY